jgi:hypothetical protein
MPPRSFKQENWQGKSETSIYVLIMQVEKKVQVRTDLKTIAGNPVTLCMDPNFTTITTCLIQREQEDQFDKK